MVDGSFLSIDHYDMARAAEDRQAELWADALRHGPVGEEDLPEPVGDSFQLKNGTWTAYVIFRDQTHAHTEGLASQEAADAWIEKTKGEK